MRICNNLAAMNTYRQYSISGTNVSGSVQKLSSGQRINSAADDSAGLSISEKMQAQIRGLNQASKNSQDGISLLQTAEGALNETHGILQRMRELAVQSSSDTNDGSVDRAALDQEFQQMKYEINDIANQTQFNGIHLLKGMTSAPAANATGLAAGITVSADNTASAGTINIATVSDWSSSAAVAGTGSLVPYFQSQDDIPSATVTGSIAAGSAYNGTYYLKATGSAMSDMTFGLVLGDGGFGTTVASTGSMSVSAGSDYTLNFGDYGSIDVTIGTSATPTDLQWGLIGNSSGSWSYVISGGTDAVATATIGGQSVTQGDSSVTLATGVTLDISSLDATDWASQDALNTALFGSTNGSASIGVTAGVMGLTIQTGANAGDTLNIAIGAMDATTLGIGSSDVTSRDNASTAITTVNTAINKVSTQRADLGAYQNRLKHKISNLDTSAENLQAAESRIRDVDIAQEMMKYTKNNILVQAATAMLAQANSAPQNVLKLLQ